MRPYTRPDAPAIAPITSTISGETFVRHVSAVATTTSAIPSIVGAIVDAIAMPLPATSPTASGARTAASTMRGRVWAKRVHARDAT